MVVLVVVVVGDGGGRIDSRSVHARSNVIRTTYHIGLGKKYPTLSQAGSRAGRAYKHKQRRVSASGERHRESGWDIARRETGRTCAVVESLITGNIHAVLHSTCGQCSVLHPSKISTHVAVSPGLGIGGLCAGSSARIG